MTEIEITKHEWTVMSKLEPIMKFGNAGIRKDKVRLGDPFEAYLE